MQTEPVPSDLSQPNQPNDGEQPGAAGTARLDIRLELEPGASLEINLEARTPHGRLLERRHIVLSNRDEAGQPVIEGDLPVQINLRPKTSRFTRPAWLHLPAHIPIVWATWLFGGALLVYLLTRLIGLANFPIYFFTDEAVQTVRAADLVRDNFQGYTKEFLPTFFANGNQYNLSTSVYLQVIPYLLFGRSIWVTRGIAVLLTLLAAWAVGRILKDIYHNPYPWTGILILSVTPAWFLHSRTAFETAFATSIYAAFIYCYMMYRCSSPRYIYAAITLGALAMYTYSPMQLIMVVTAVLLLFSDLPYHWRQRKLWLSGAGLALVLAIPYARFLYNHPGENLKHLQILDSYWVQNIPTSEKLSHYFREYLSGLNPAYWYLPNDKDFARHRMDGYGHLLLLSLPFVITGFVLAIKRIRFSPNRVLLAAFLAAPSGAAMVNLGITRALVMVIPAALLAALGLSALLAWLERFRLKRAVLGMLTFAILAGLNFYLLDDALTNGPTWFQDYGLGGMQYGARQVFAAIGEQARLHPEDAIMLSPSWANGTDELARFFYPVNEPFKLGTIDGFMIDQQPLGANNLFVMIPEELDRAVSSGKFKNIRLEKFLRYPNGTPGFFFVRLQYSESFDAMIAAEKDRRKILSEQDLKWEGNPVKVLYSTLDMGKIQDAFDGNDQSILRTLEANPLMMDIQLGQARMMKGLGARIGGTTQKITLYVDEIGQSHPLVFRQTLLETPDPRYVNFLFPKAINVMRVRIELENIYDGEPAHVHLWEVRYW